MNALIKRTIANPTSRPISRTGINILLSFAVMGIFAAIPPIAPLTNMGMDVLGVFLGTVLLLSLVDTTWPAILSMALFSATGIMSLDEIIAISIGNWITVFVIMGFVLTYALNSSGFTGRLTAFFMSRKLARRSPWSFTVMLISLPFLAASFMEPSATIVFFLGLSQKIFEELGYQKTDRYPHMVTMAVVFAAGIATSMTPISHPLIALGLNFYQQTTGVSINLITYILYAVPVGILVFAAMLVILRLFFKADLSRISDFEVEKVLDKVGPMDRREQITVAVFFGTVIMWFLPAILSMAAPNWTLSAILNRYTVTFWAIIAVVLLAVIKVDGTHVLDLKRAFIEGVNWNVIFLAAACVLMGSVVTNEAVGLSQFVLSMIGPITQTLSPAILLLFLVALTSLLTNFTSNMTAMILMLSVGLSLVVDTGGLTPFVVTLSIIVTSDFAFVIPSSSNLIGMLYGNEYSSGNAIFKYGCVLAIVSVFIVVLFGYSFSSLLI